MLFYPASGIHNKEELRNIFRIESLIRVVSYLFLSITLTVRLYLNLFSYDPTPLLLLAYGAFLISSFSLIVANKGWLAKYYTRLIQILPFIEIALITAMVHFSGGIESRLSFLYLLPCLSVSLFSLRFAIGISLTSLFAYAGLILSTFYEIIPAVERFGYSMGELAFINFLRLTLMIGITMFVAIIFFARLLEISRSRLDNRDKTLSSVANQLTEPLEKASSVLESIKRGHVVSEETIREAELLKTNIQDTLLKVSDLISEAQEPTPLSLAINFHKGNVCNVCNKPIIFLERYWAIPKSYRIINKFGQHQNEIHCNTCHTAEKECTYCAIWVGQPNHIS